MNEQIKRLLDQATMDALYETQDAVDLLDNPVTKQQRQLQLEKFAELIVRECEKVAKDGPWYYDTPSLRSGWQNPINHVCNVMKEHFGVEE